jgi:hypothetical protein
MAKRPRKPLQLPSRSLPPSFPDPNLEAQLRAKAAELNEVRCDILNAQAAEERLQTELLDLRHRLYEARMGAFVARLDQALVDVLAPEHIDGCCSSKGYPDPGCTRCALLEALETRTWNPGFTFHFDVVRR